MSRGVLFRAGVEEEITNDDAIYLNKTFPGQFDIVTAKPKPATKKTQTKKSE